MNIIPQGLSYIRLLNKNLLTLDIIHSRDFLCRNYSYLTVSNVYPVGHCLAKCLADCFTQQTNEASEQFSRTGMKNLTESIAYAHSTESWYSPLDPTGGFDGRVYHPDNQVRIFLESLWLSKLSRSMIHFLSRISPIS
jgi:hypothetical protein